MNTKKTAIAASIAALLAAPVAAFAKDQWEYHEDQWSNVTSYGNVPLAQDSSEAWGPWAEFIMPAAGGPVINPVQFVGEGSGERYRPHPQTIEPPKADDEPPAVVPPPVVVDACAAGAWCGYAVYGNSQNDLSNFDSHYNTLSDGGEGTAKVALFLKPDDPSSVKLGTGNGEGTVQFDLTYLHGAEPFQATTGEMGAEFGWWSDEGLHDFGAGDPYSWHSYTGAEGWDHGYLSSNDEVAVGWFKIQQYVSGGDGGEHNVSGYFVAGIQTPQTYLDSQAAGKVNGVGYWGGSLDPHGSGVDVTMTVNFGSGTWSGSWNGGQDSGSGVINHAATDGTKYVYGNVGFNASGTISGAQIQSTSISATDGIIDAAKSSVQGTFFGKEAGSIGGAHHIVKTVNTGDQEYYTNATNVGVFLVNKGTPPE